MVEERLHSYLSILRQALETKAIKALHHVKSDLNFGDFLTKVRKEFPPFDEWWRTGYVTTAPGRYGRAAARRAAREEGACHRSLSEPARGPRPCATRE